MDFVNELEGQGNSNEFFEAVFNSILDSESPEACNCSSAIAAAEIIAKANGHHSRARPEEVYQWLDEYGFRPSKSLTTKAINACRKILQSSELKDLWENHPAWRKSVARTVERLERAPKRSSKKSSPKRQRAKAGTKSGSNAISRIKRNSTYVHFEKRKPVSVAIDVNKLDAELIADLKATSSITHLDFSGVIEAGANPLHDLAQVTQLKVVWAGDCHRLRDDHLSFCNSLPNLMSLNVRDQKITDCGMAHLESCKRLEVLNIDGTEVTDAGLEVACRGKNIGHLSAVRTRLTGEGFKSFLPGTLDYVDFEEGQLSDDGLRHLSLVSQNVKTLSLAHCDKVTDGGLAHLTSLKAAEQLWLGGPKLSDTGFAFLEQLGNLKYLFVFESTRDFCTNVVQHLKKSNVEHIQLNGCFNQEDLLLLSTAKQLKHIALVGSTVSRPYGHQLAKELNIQIELS